MDYDVQRDIFERLRELTTERKNLLVSALSDQAETVKSSRRGEVQRDKDMELFTQEIALRTLVRYAQVGPNMRQGDTIDMTIDFPKLPSEPYMSLKVVVTYEGAVTFDFNSVMRFTELPEERQGNILQGMKEGIHFYRLPALVVTPLGFTIISYEASKGNVSEAAMNRLTRIERFFNSLLNAIMEKGYASIGGVFEAFPINKIQKNLSMSLFKSELLYQTSHSESALDLFLKEIEGSFGVSFEECRKLLDFVGVTGRNTRWLSPKALYDLCYGSQSHIFREVYPTQDDMVGRMYDYFSIQNGRKDRMFLTRRELTARETTAVKRSLKTKAGEQLKKEAYRNLSKRGKIFSYSFVPSRMSYEARQQAEKFVRTPTTENADFLSAERSNRRLVFSLRAVIEFLMAENFSDQSISEIVRPLFEHFELQKFLLDDETIEWALLRVGDQTELQNIFLMRGLLIGQHMPHEDEARTKDLESLTMYFAAHPGIREGMEVAQRQGRRFNERDLRKYAPDLSELFDYPDRKIEEMGGVQFVKDKMMLFKEQLFPTTRHEVDVAVGRFIDYSRENFEDEIATSKIDSIDNYSGLKHYLKTMHERGVLTDEKFNKLKGYANNRFAANGILDHELEALKSVMEKPELEYNGWSPILNEKGEVKYD